METKRQENPDRYARLSPQPIEYMRQAMPQAEFRGFCRGNIIKYACRMGFKDSFATCAKKIEDYARWIRQSEQGKPLTWKDTDDEYYGLTDEERKEAAAIAHELMGESKDKSKRVNEFPENGKEVIGSDGRIFVFNDGRWETKEE